LGVRESGFRNPCLRRRHRNPTPPHENPCVAIGREPLPTREGRLDFRRRRRVILLSKCVLQSREKGELCAPLCGRFSLSAGSFQVASWPTLCSFRSSCLIAPGELGFTSPCPLLRKEGVQRNGYSPAVTTLNGTTRPSARLRLLSVAGSLCLVTHGLKSCAG